MCRLDIDIKIQLKFEFESKLGNTKLRAHLNNIENKNNSLSQKKNAQKWLRFVDSRLLKQEKGK